MIFIWNLNPQKKEDKKTKKKQQDALGAFLKARLAPGPKTVQRPYDILVELWEERVGRGLEGVELVQKRLLASQSSLKSGFHHADQGEPK